MHPDGLFTQKLNTSSIMGIGTAIAAGIGSILSVVGQQHAANQQKKAMEAQQRAAEEAAKRNVTVGRQQEDPAPAMSDASQMAEEQAQNDKRRRRSIASTVRSGSLLSSLGTGRTTLGG